MKKAFIAFCGVTLLFGKSYGQSYHFSQFFSTPLLTNPANTGFTDGAYRFASNFRSQGISGGSPYLTGYISADVSPLRKNLPAGHRAGIGMYIMNDQSLNGALQTNSVGFSLAYNVGLDEEGGTTLGLGLQGAYHQRRIDYTNLTFDTQFGRNGYNAALPVGEDFNFYKKNFLDVNAGILYSERVDDKSFFWGVSVYNILKHKDNMLAEEFQVPTRYVMQSGLQLFSGTYGKVYLSGTHMRQAKASETTLGAAYGLQLTDDEKKNEVNFGLWYRFKDALIPYIGYQKGGFQVGLSYDYTTSQLKTGAQVRNGYELTLLYTAPDLTDILKYVPWY